MTTQHFGEGAGDAAPEFPFDLSGDMEDPFGLNEEYEDEEQGMGEALPEDAPGGVETGTGTSASAREEALAAATHARDGARATFEWLEPELENDALLEDGAWLEDAVAAAVLL